MYAANLARGPRASRAQRRPVEEIRLAASSTASRTENSFAVRSTTRSAARPGRAALARRRGAGGSSSVPSSPRADRPRASFRSGRTDRRTRAGGRAATSWLQASARRPSPSTKQLPNCGRPSKSASTTSVGRRRVSSSWAALAFGPVSRSSRSRRIARRPRSRAGSALASSSREQPSGFEEACWRPGMLDRDAVELLEEASTALPRVTQGSVSAFSPVSRVPWLPKAIIPERPSFAPARSPGGAAPR